MARVLRFISRIETELSISSNFCNYILNENIFHKAYLFCYFSCDYDTSIWLAVTTSITNFPFYKTKSPFYKIKLRIMILTFNILKIKWLN